MLDQIIEVAPRADWDAALQQTLVEYAAGRVKVRKRRWRFGIAITIPAVLLAASLTGGLLWVQASVSNKSVVHCFARAELDPLGHYPGLDGAASGRDSMDARIEDALAACSVMWSSDELDPAAPDGVHRASDRSVVVDPTGMGSVPDLRVCVMRDGSAAVVPGGADICAQLGLARLG